MLLERQHDPLKQALLVYAGALILMLLGWVIGKTGLYPVERLFAWTIATAFTLLFALYNSLMSLTAPNAIKYWGRSIYTYVALAVLNGLTAWLLSGVALNDAESYRWIYIVITFGFLVFLSMVNFIRRIVSFAEREEWNAPRKRRR
jgi:hypothetical protein